MFDGTVFVSFCLFFPAASNVFDRQLTSDTESTSGANVDDWFESPSNASNSLDVVPWKTDDITPQASLENPFQETFFQPIRENQSDQRRSNNRILILPADNAKARQSTTASPLSESNTFVRTPEPPMRRPSSSLSNAARRSPLGVTYSGATLAIPNIQHHTLDWREHDKSPIEPNEN